MIRLNKQDYKQIWLALYDRLDYLRKENEKDKNHSRLTIIARAIIATEETLKKIVERYPE